LSGCGLFGQADPTVDRALVRDGATLSLLDPGSAPRRPVTFTLTEGDSVDLEFRVDLHLTQRTSDTEAPQVLDPPVTRQTVRLTVGRADPDGADVSFEVVDAGIDPADTSLTDVQIMELTAAVQAVVGLRGRLHVDDHGAVDSIRYEGPTDLPAELADTMRSFEQNLSSLVPVLPTEPIGRGARWRTVSRTGAAGVTVRQTTDYEVTGIEDGRITYRASISQGAPEQDVDGEQDLRLLAADVVGTTTGMVSTTGLATESETSLRGTQVVELRSGAEADAGATRRVTQDLDILVTVAPVATADPPRS
jgi:hypothetical protein